MTHFYNKLPMQFLQCLTSMSQSLIITLIRAAGTGRYADMIGQRLPASSSFAEVVSKKRPYVVSDKENDPICKNCARKATCHETCHICYPLSVDNRPLGVIALVGFTDEQKHRIQQHRDQYMDFLHQMARLVEKAALSDIAAQKLEKTHNQVQGIVESVGEDYCNRWRDYCLLQWRC